MQKHEISVWPLDEYMDMLPGGPAARRTNLVLVRRCGIPSLVEELTARQGLLVVTIISASSMNTTFRRKGGLGEII